MKRVCMWLFATREDRQSSAAIVFWWEVRRIPFNLIVGAVASCSLLLFFTFIDRAGVLKPGEDAVEPIALMAAPLVINVAYTAGWLTELALRLVHVEGPAVGPTLLKVGLALSLAVVIFPSAFWGGYCALQLFSVIS